MTRGKRNSVDIAPTESAVPDVLAPGLDVVFCGINPGRVSAAAHAHFANPRNDFWRLLHDAGLTPRLLEPSEQFELLDYGIGATNAAARTTPGSSDLRRADFADSADRLRRIALELRPRAIAFVGKEAYRGAFGTRADHGPQERSIGDVGLFVLPSTSPANAAVPYAERLRWFRALRDWLEPVERIAVRGARARRETPHVARPVPRRRGTGVVDDARRRHRRGRRRRVGAPSRARRGARAGRLRHSAPSSGRVSTPSRGAARSTASASASGSSRSPGTSRLRGSISPPSSSSTSGGGRRTSSKRPRKRSSPSGFRSSYAI